MGIKLYGSLIFADLTLFLQYITDRCMYRV